MLTFEDTTFGIQRCELNLAELYPASEERGAFLDRFEAFVRSDEANQQIYSLQGDTFRYCSEVFASDRVDERPPVLLLLGNPASHSVAAGMCFAFEKGRREHRFWKSLYETGLLAFLKQIESTDVDKMNRARREALLEMEYRSPFRIGIAVFYSLPSSASGSKWSGVGGVKRLLGTRAFEEISLLEEHRIKGLVEKFIGAGGGIVAFQKDAYERVRSIETPTYSRELAMQGALLGKYKDGRGVWLAGAPPTRVMHTVRGKAALRRCEDWLAERVGEISSQESLIK